MIYYYIVEVLKGKRESVKDIFVAKMKSGHTGVFWRSNRETWPRKSSPLSQYGISENGRLVKRLGIFEKYGPRLENLYAKELADDGILQKFADERMKKNFEHNVDYLFRKKNEMV